MALGRPQAIKETSVSENFQDGFYPDGLPGDVSVVTDEAALRAMHKEPMTRSTDKVLPALDRHCRAIIAKSPFCLISSQSDDGADISPRGDPPGFVRVIDKSHLLLPDRVGNNRLDNAANLLKNPKIGMLFLVPGMNETLRVNGLARITDDRRLLDPCAVKGRAPITGLLITVNEAFVHCAKALQRSELWNPDVQIQRNELPSYATMLVDHCEGLTQAESDRQGKIMAERGLY
ncbi:pyridoxamine 5'-phosphate oxidase family protein [Hwanghaeella grinnelliae]|uniref:Pyridoxamine 5'-phosphate oxidase family protein n=1 Tax=Hwanghaeella grinnelliae TaxID=2500179 RepID=A0A3S3URJ8_9PROT|nr:pyridoxamine 5'-phosphate oxidase family protein [Hwanghaeella grinnelliae]